MKRNIFIILIILLPIIIVISPSILENYTISQLKKNLAKDFTNTYPRTVKSEGETKEITLNASERTVKISGNDLKLWTYLENNFPPVITLDYGQKLKINLTNNLNQDTTIHFHGVRVPNNMDGVPEVSQKPVKPGEQFTYEFVPKDPGTYWFHSHVNSSEQIERGLYGALIVKDKEPEQYSQDITWIVDDWLLDDSGKIDPRFNTRGNLSHDGRWGNLLLINGKNNELLKASPGERIRLRLINASNGRVYKLNFGDLPFEVLAVDGTKVAAGLSLSDLDFAPGNRIDLDIKIPSILESKSYNLTDQYTRTVYTLGSIQVEGDLTNVQDFSGKKSDTSDIWQQALSLELDKEYILDAVSGGKFGITWTINGQAYPDHETVNLKQGQFYKIRFTNKSARLHPMHLHGQFFKVISRNGVFSNENAFRDTILVNSKETIDIGVLPLEKGQWMLHCHILEHSESGMMTMVNVN